MPIARKYIRGKILYFARCGQSSGPGKGRREERKEERKKGKRKKRKEKGERKGRSLVGKDGGKSKESG